MLFLVIGAFSSYIKFIVGDGEEEDNEEECVECLQNIGFVKES